MPKENDPFADALESYWLAGRGSYRYTREDGWTAEEDAWWYFTSYPDFPRAEKRALRFARGRILDIGCGAGRHSLYLQRKGLRVTGIDSSSRVAAIALARGVRDVRVASACKLLPFRDREFDTVLLFGNNLGICGSYSATGRLLRELARITTARGRILATTLTPGTFDNTHVAYWSKKLEQGSDLGAMRFRLTFEGGHPKDVSLVVFSPTDLMRLAWKNGWALAQIFSGEKPEDGYSVVMERKKD